MKNNILNILRLAKILLSEIKYISEEDANRQWEEYKKLHPNRRELHTREKFLKSTSQKIKEKESQGKDIGNVSDDVKDKLEIIPYFYSHPLYGGKKKQAVKDSGLDFTLPDRSSDRYLVKLNVDKFDNRWLESDTRNDFYIGKGGVGNVIGKRYDGFEEWLKNSKEPIEVSETGVNELGNIDFLNGRHRYSWLRDNDKPVWVALPESDIKNALKFGLIDKWVSKQTNKLNTVKKDTVSDEVSKKLEEHFTDSSFPKVQNYGYGRNISIVDGFTKGSQQKINETILKSKGGKLSKPELLGSVEEVLHPKINELLPKTSQGVSIYLSSKLNNKSLLGFATGKNSDGNHVIVMNPEQASYEYVRGLLHEIKHIDDKEKGVEVTTFKDIDEIKHKEYEELLSEKRARKFEENILKKLEKIQKELQG